MQLVVARIGRAHGIKGEVTVEVRTDEPELRLGPGAVLATDPAATGPLTIETGRVHSGRLLLRFAGVRDRTGAEALRNTLLIADVDPEEQPEDADEYYDHQLMDLDVVLADGTEIGRITEISHLASQDLFIVEREDGSEVMIPFVEEIVTEIDLEKQRAVITPPPGLIDDRAEIASARDSEAAEDEALMRLDVVTIFPEYLEPLNVSLVGKARARGRLDVHVHDLREYTYDRHNTVDDTPYGGGPGMVMKTEPWGDALDTLLADGYEAGLGGPVMVVPTPSGRPFTQELAVELSERPWLVFTPARYEGIDRRVMDEYATRMPVYEVSIGDYVLAGGEAAVLVITEAVARLLPGVLGNAESHRDDSFAPGAMANLLEGPVYTKPPEWRGRDIPDVLVSGHHGKIARWRRDEALRRTTANRPDLIERCDPSSFDKKDREMLSILGWAPGPDGRFGRTPGAVEE